MMAGAPSRTALKKAVAAAGVAGDAELVDQQKDGVAITIPPKVHKRLVLAGTFAFAP